MLETDVDPISELVELMVTSKYMTRWEADTANRDSFKIYARAELQGSQVVHSRCYSIARTSESFWALI